MNANPVPQCFLAVPATRASPHWQAAKLSAACPARRALPLAPPARWRARGGGDGGRPQQQQQQPRQPPSSPPRPPVPASSPPPALARLAAGAVALLVRMLTDDVRGLDVDVDFATNGDALRGCMRGATLRATRIALLGAAVSGGFVARLPPLELAALGREPFGVSLRATITQADLNVRGGVWFSTLESLLRDVVKISVSTAMGRDASVGDRVVTELERVELEPAISRPGSRTSPANPASFFTAVVWDILSPRVAPAPSTGKIILHARTTFADGTVRSYSVRSRMSFADSGTVLEFDQPEIMWRGVGLPLLVVGKAGIKLSNETVITALEITSDGLCVEGLAVIDFSGPIAAAKGPKLSVLPDAWGRARNTRSKPRTRARDD